MPPVRTRFRGKGVNWEKKHAKWWLKRYFADTHAVLDLKAINNRYVDAQAQLYKEAQLDADWRDAVDRSSELVNGDERTELLAKHPVDISGRSPPAPPPGLPPIPPHPGWTKEVSERYEVEQHKNRRKEVMRERFYKDWLYKERLKEGKKERSKKAAATAAEEGKWNYIPMP